MKNHQVIIIGGGPAGGVSALDLLQLGIKPLVLEKEVLPCSHIGEVLADEALQLLRQCLPKPSTA